jgi:hypothetical protein
VELSVSTLAARAPSQPPGEQVWQAGRVHPSRRQVLTGTVVALSAACTSHRSDRPAPPDPDVALTADAVARELALLAAYDAALRAVPTLADELGPYRSDHAAHLAALRAAASATPGAEGTVGPFTGPGPGRSARAALAAAERAAAAAHTTATTTASPRLAGLLASLAASEASHAALL